MSAESQNCKASTQPLLGNGSANTPFGRQQPSLNNAPMQLLEAFDAEAKYDYKRVLKRQMLM
jgi:hypothetical protein